MTNHISLNIGSVPLPVGVIPLAVYLLTFIMAFARKIRLSTKTVSAIATVALLVIFPVAAVGIPVRSTLVWALLSSHVAILFFGALLCHSALADRRPTTKYLTEFYFVVALGGVLGGIFTAIIAPAIFSTVFEYPLLVALVAFFRVTPRDKQAINWQDIAAVFAVVAMLTITVYCLDWAKIDVTDSNAAAIVTDSIFVLTALLFRKRFLRFGLVFAMLVINYATVLPRYLEGATRIYVARDFFGVKKVLYDPDDNTRKLLHGDTMHGLEGSWITRWPASRCRIIMQDAWTDRRPDGAVKPPSTPARWRRWLGNGKHCRLWRAGAAHYLFRRRSTGGDDRTRILYLSPAMRRQLQHHYWRRTSFHSGSARS